MRTVALGVGDALDERGGPARIAARRADEAGLGPRAIAGNPARTRTDGAEQDVAGQLVPEHVVAGPGSHRRPDVSRLEAAPHDDNPGLAGRRADGPNDLEAASICRIFLETRRDTGRIERRPVHEPERLADGRRLDDLDRLGGEHLPHRPSHCSARVDQEQLHASPFARGSPAPFFTRPF